MAGAGKNRVRQERASNHPESQRASSRNGSSSSGGASSSSGKATQSAVSTTSHGSRNSRDTRTSRRDGYDGNRDPQDAAVREPETARPQVDIRNIDLGVHAYAVMRGQELTALDPRPAPSTLGSAIKMGLNTYHVSKFPDQKVYQFDVLIGNGVEKRGLVKKVWESKAVQSTRGPGFIFDGNRLAWSLKPIEREMRILVDLDAEDGRTPRNGKENKHRIMIRQTNAVRFDSLVAYLAGTCAFNNAILEAINFLDHLLREHPSKRFTPIKRAFYSHEHNRPVTLGSAVEALKGVYQSMRIVHGGVSSKARLTINVDVSNGTFWSENKLIDAAVQLIGCRNASDLVSALQQGEFGRSGQALKKMRKLHVVATHRGKKDEYVIEKFVYKSARDHKFEQDGKTISIYDYYAQKYNHRLLYPNLPLVKMTRGKNTLLPMESLQIEAMQRYNFKMDEKQTSNMIKFAVTPPPQRLGDIEHGLRALDWPSDPVHRAFGLQIETRKVEVDARLLPPPTVKFGAGEAKPGTSGRWDLKGKKFLQPNTAPLKSWAVCVIPGRRGGKPDRSVVQNFVAQFLTIYKSHGGKVENTQPAMSLASGDDVGTWVTAAWNAAGNQTQARPQMLVFVLPDKDSVQYGRIKRSCECRYGVVSQCMQYAHVQKAQAQYISNVCMKFNAKLGGITARATGPKTGGPTGVFTVPTMVIGADVTHASPGQQTPSIAAFTVALDKLATRYAAVCQTNGFRIEMIGTDVITELKPMVQSWAQNVNGGKPPTRVLYFRDGVSEGQYQHVLQQEVHDLKAMFKTAAPGYNVQFVVVVGSKRHHVRFFPPTGKGDRNGNPLPGTLVESGVTHAFENDFYLCSHAAIKGTARPMHYYVLLNEAKMKNEEIQTLIYEQCYQYIRATTPVSQHPAMYYAHIAAGRAIPHDPKWSGSSDTSPTQAAAARPRSSSQSGSQSGSQGRSGSHGGSSSGAPVDIEKLMPMPNHGNINTAMWYI